MARSFVVSIISHSRGDFDIRHITIPVELLLLHVCVWIRFKLSEHRMEVCAFTSAMVYHFAAHKYVMKSGNLVIYPMFFALSLNTTCEVRRFVALSGAKQQFSPQKIAAIFVELIKL